MTLLYAHSYPSNGNAHEITVDLDHANWAKMHIGTKTFATGITHDVMSHSWTAVTDRAGHRWEVRSYPCGQPMCHCAAQARPAPSG